MELAAPGEDTAEIAQAPRDDSEESDDQPANLDNGSRPRQMDENGPDDDAQHRRRRRGRRGGRGRKPRRPGTQPGRWA